MKMLEEFLRQSIALAAQARERGNHPFGAVLAVDDRLLLAAENTVITNRNPTAHAETNLIQRAILEIEPEVIARSTLYTSCEPCAMCAGAIYWAGIREVAYALPSEELARLAGADFPVPCRELFSRAREAVEVTGPHLMQEALKVHEGYWPSHG